MKIKTHIAVILTFIFLAKFMAIEANGLNMLFNDNDITFVNPHCKKDNSAKKSDGTLSFSQQDTIDAQVVALSGNCISPFQFELFSWDIGFSDFILVFNAHIPSGLSYRYLDNVSPPPQTA